VGTFSCQLSCCHRRAFQFRGPAGSPDSFRHQSLLSGNCGNSRILPRGGEQPWTLLSSEMRMDRKYLRVIKEATEKWHDRLYSRGAVFAFLSWVQGVSVIFASGLGILRPDILTTAAAMLSGKFPRYLLWFWISGLVF
jgi:hypothetical protein